MLVAAEVVHRLQPIAVADDHRYRHVVGRCASQLVVEALVEAAAVEEPGQLVGDGGALLTPQRSRNVDQRGRVLGEQRRGFEVILGWSGTGEPSR